MQFTHLPFLIIISSPSGAGKSTICKKLVDSDQKLKLSVSVTTRKKRAGEIEGKDYYFVSKEHYNLMVQNNELLEYAHIFDYDYGTPRKMVKEEMGRGIDLLFDIDWQGARQISQKFAKEDVITIFILPPSLEELHKRLGKRAEHTKEAILERMKKAKSEISHYYEYEYILINDNLEETCQKIKAIIEATRIKRVNRHDQNLFVTQILES